MDVIFTDLDGTLLDAETYGWQEARPALDLLEKRGCPCIFATSKTRQETEYFRAAMQNRHPFITENGGAAYIPQGSFNTPVHGARLRDGYEVLEWGRPYQELVSTLSTLSAAAQCPVLGFHSMTAEQIAAACNLPLHLAVPAKQREYDEPFTVINPDRAAFLLNAIENAGLHWTQGGRFFHICGNHDKALAVAALIAFYRKQHTQVNTIGLGDSINDLGFLQQVAHPVLIPSPNLALLRKSLPHASVPNAVGPKGWNQAVLEFLSPS